MSHEEIEQVRSVSRASRNGPWVQWWGEMARNIVMRRLSKRLPMSTDIEDDVFRGDDTMAVDFKPRVIEGGQAESKVSASRLDALAHHVEGEHEEGAAESECSEAHTVDPVTLRKHIDEATDCESWEAAEGAAAASDLDNEQRLELSHALTVKLDELKAAR